MIIFGIADKGGRVGLAESLANVLDPARITDQLRRKAPLASVKTTYLEITYYHKRFGALIISPLSVPLVFDVEWSYSLTNGKPSIVIQPGVLYVRMPGQSAPARQADVREIWQRSVDVAAQRTLARIEQVASLPPDAELIVSTSAIADAGYVLGVSGEGRPVRIVDDPDAPAVRLSEVLSPDVPYSSVNVELAGQVRQQQQADFQHRVSKQALLRWWLQRDEISLDDVSASFCLLSAAYNHGYPMYWASSMSLQALRRLLDDELAIGKSIPCQSYPYVVGAFFWGERAQIGSSLTPSQPCTAEGG